MLSLSFLLRFLRSRIIASVLCLFFLCARRNPNVYARQHPWAHAGRCANGYLTASRKSFWKYSDGTLPAIADVLTSGNRLYVVLSLEVLENHRTSKATYEWQTAKWTFAFVDLYTQAIAATSFGIMKDPNVLILHAPLPATVTTAEPGHRPFHIDITATSPERAHTYMNVPFCLTPAVAESSESKYQLAACIKCIPKEPWIQQLPEWIMYHIQQGIQHVYLYSVGDPGRMHQLLAPFVRVGWVTIVDWEWPDNWVYAYLMSEAHQNACLLRARGVAEWVAFADVDEFWQPRSQAMPGGPLLTVAEVLKQPEIRSESALRANSWYFGPNSNQTKQREIESTAGDMGIAKWISCDGDAIRDGRWKNIVRPEKITYMGTHLVATGPSERLLDPEKQMRVVHFKSHLSFADRDEGMLRYDHGVKSMLYQFGF